MHISENASLKHLNTFGFDIKARYLISPQSPEEAHEAIAWASANHLSVMILGEGSNVVLTHPIDAAVIHPTFSGFELINQDNDFYYVKVSAGMNWHQCVKKTLASTYWGLENLSLIPGLVGAAPIQNIGAYGVELSRIFYELEAIEIATGHLQVFTNTDCCFDYRDSIFKKTHKDQFLITSVTFKLFKNPQLVLDYAGVTAELATMNVEPSPQTVSAAICNLRRRKLPNPYQIGNVGSFFKNPVISLDHYRQLSQTYPDIIAYDASGAKKIAAGWLIEKAGWKGKQAGNVAVHAMQALVLVNHEGRGSGAEIIALATQIKKSVEEQFGIILEQEPRIY